jgi:hypothetical protein
MPALVLRAPQRAALNLDDLVLSVGAHSTVAEGVCVMEAASIVAGEVWSDRPTCASPVISRFLRRWNDTLPWRPRQALKRYICPVIGTATTDADEAERLDLVRDWVVREYAPAWLALAGLNRQATALSSLPAVTAETIAEVRPVLEDVRRAAVLGTQPERLNLPVVRRVARETAWDAASATLTQELWGEAPPPPACDQSLMLDVALMALAAATDAQVGPTASALRRSAHELVEQMCTVGRPARQRWSA